MIIDTNEIYSVDAEGRVFSGYDTPKREFYVKPSEEWEEQSTASVADKQCAVFCAAVSVVVTDAIQP